MSTFLELVQALHTESGAAGVAPTAVTGQTGEAARLVRWVREADYRIQTKWINWKFLRAEWTTSNTTTASNPNMSAPADLKTWDLETFSIIYPGQTEAYPIDVIEYEEVKREVLDTTEGIPDRVIVMPDNSLRLEPIPNGVYTLLADYYVSPTKLAANGDISAIPIESHEDAILGRAMQFYGNYENAPEIKTQGQELYSEGMAELENHQLPNKNYSRMRTGGGFEVIGGQ